MERQKLDAEQENGNEAEHPAAVPTVLHVMFAADAFTLIYVILVRLSPLEREAVRV